MNPEELQTTETTTPTDNTTTTTTEPSTEPVAASTVQLETTQYQTFIDQSNQLNLLTNRVEAMLLLNIVLIALIIFQFMRSK